MSDLRPPPYPADTRAKGWRFELDYEQIEQSGTWGAAMALAMEGLPLARPFLLAMWYAAWKQVPCGSLPTNDRELAGAIGIPTSVLAEYSEVLLRGWWVADDGRYYHPTLTARVREMMSKRRSDADRQAKRRGAMSPPESGGEASDSHAGHAAVTRDKPVTQPGVGRESSTDQLPPSKSSPSSKTLSKPAASHPSAEGFGEFWLAWPKNERKQDKAACLDLWKRKGFEAIAAVILADVRVKRGTEKWADGFIEAPLVYLRNKRWEDGVTPNSAGDHEDLGDWRKDRKTVEAKGVAVGLGKWDEDGFQHRRHFETFAAYEERVAARVLELEGQPA